MKRLYQFKPLFPAILMLMLVAVMSCAVSADEGTSGITEVPEETTTIETPAPDKDKNKKTETIIITVTEEESTVKADTENSVHTDEKDITDASLFSVDIQPPSPPSNLFVGTVTDTTATVEWSPSLDNQGVENYLVFVNYILVGVTENTSYTFEVENEHVYFVLVRARDYSGNISDSSNMVSFYHICDGSAAPVTLIAPTSLSINQSWENKVTLSWHTNGGNGSGAYYEIYNGDTLIGITQEAFYTIHNLVAGQSYAFRVRAANPDGLTSGFTNTININFNNHDWDTTLPPYNLDVVTADSASVTIAWNHWDYPRVKEFVIYDGDRIIGTTSATTYTITGLVYEDTFEFSVKARDYYGNLTGSSNTVSYYHTHQSPRNYITAAVSEEGGIVTVSGIGLTGNSVSVTVRDIQNTVIYSGSTECNLAFGAYHMAFYMPAGSGDGIYTVAIACEGVTKTIVTAFAYTASAITSADVAFNENGMLTVDGQTNVGVGRTVLLYVVKQDAIVEEKVTVTETDGSFEFAEFALPPGAGSGEYTAVIMCEGITAFVTRTFIYADEVLTVPSQIYADISVIGRRVTVLGTTIFGEGNEITTVVKDANGENIYLGQTTSRADGAFSFAFVLPDSDEDAQYTVIIGGGSITNLYAETFSGATHKAGAVAADINVDGKDVSVSFVVRGATDQRTAITVKDSDGGIIYLNQATNNAGMKHTFNFKMPADAKDGDYTVLIGAASLDTTQIITFAYRNINNTLDIDVHLNNNIVIVSGTSSYETGTVLALSLIKPSNNTPLFPSAVTTMVLSDGSFAFAPLTMPEGAQIGQYVAEVTVQNTHTPYTMAFTYSYVEEHTISAYVYVNGRTVTINGTTAAGPYGNVTAIIRNEDRILYLDQCQSDANGAFVLNFSMPQDAVNGEYTVLLGGDGANQLTSIVFDYEAGIPAPLTVFVSVDDYDITISGKLAAGGVQTLYLYIEVTVPGDDGGGLEFEPIFEEIIITEADGSYTFVLSRSVLGYRDYYVFVRNEDGSARAQKGFILYPPSAFTAPVLLPVRNEDITDKTVKLSWQAAQGGTGEFTYSVYRDGVRIAQEIAGTSYLDTNLTPETAYTYKIAAVYSEQEIESNALTVVTKQTAVVSVQNSIVITCEDGQTYNLIIVGENIQHLDAKVFIIEYDPNVLEVVDLCSLTKHEDIAAGNVGQTDIVIIEHDKENGVIKFTVNKSYDGKKWTGVANGIKFIAIDDGDTTVTQTLE